MHAQQEKENISMSNQNDTIDALVNIKTWEINVKICSLNILKDKIQICSWAIQRNEKYETKIR